MKSLVKRKLSDMALKMDINKAYDIIDWKYLRGIMVKMRFLQNVD